MIFIIPPLDSHTTIVVRSDYSYNGLIKNVGLRGNAGLQLSINSTDEEERREMFSGNALTLDEMGAIVADFPKPVGRKYTLNFALAGYTIDPDVLLRVFPPEHWLCKITPMHKTHTAEANNIRTDGGYDYFYPYKETEDKLKVAGYDLTLPTPKGGGFLLH